MKKIFLTAALVAMTMSSFAQTQTTELDGIETTTGNFSGYLGYSNSELMEIMEAALDLAYDSDYNIHTLANLFDLLNATDKNNRQRVLDTYEEFMYYIPTYLEKALKHYGEEDFY